MDLNLYFCVGCVETGIRYELGVCLPNNITLGCSECPIRNKCLYQDYRKLFLSWRLNPHRLCFEIGERSNGEWLLLCGLNTYLPSCVEGMTQSYKVFHQLPKDQWISKTMEMLFANLAILKYGIVQRLMPLCVCLATLTRKGAITATISKVILLMAGNCLINKFEVFDEIVYTQCVGMTDETGRIRN